MNRKELAASLDDDELTPRFVATAIAVTLAFLVVLGLLTYYITFYVLGF